MSAIDLPPGIGLQGTALGTFHAPRRARRLAATALAIITACGAITWYVTLTNRYHWHSSTKLVLPFAFLSFAGLGYLVRRARVAVTRDGVRWGWDALGFTQEAARIVTAHVYADGVAFEAKRGSWWFIAKRDWDRFDAFVRQLRRTELPVADHAGKAPLRARLQSYGRFLDALLVGSILGAIGVMIWAA